MAHIITPAPVDFKKFDCDYCGATVGYNNKDIRKDYSVDYSEDYLCDKEWYTYVRCPSCGNKANRKWIIGYHE